ncbi:MAG: hypothetical protein ACKO9I_21870 [Sphaerospermopsis kisseleviana]|uniref:Uncharacterized protein n=1 Tax=Sphaerospermopsis kisseleviana CS-549 TaxID=3021783 RepID=A0ABT4ZVX6_9CYAN|nr:hypothetical protein [Sphaerospermopsis kisseleviana]MDB9443564.1 hypothetical protein [Sphaerospermopsis kisseleviana CS-549]BAZ80961.1 hypothetical protein NIES73_22270 [Sphaerospermopsis kisseleviana NIES-73]
MLKTVAGIYRDGQIEFTEIPENVNNSTQVLITFLDPGKIDPSKIRQLIEHLETIAGIQQGFEELNSGQARPLADFIQEMQQKYDISS